MDSLKMLHSKGESKKDKPSYDHWEKETFHDNKWLHKSVESDGEEVQKYRRIKVSKRESCLYNQHNCIDSNVLILDRWWRLKKVINCLSD